MDPIKQSGNQFKGLKLDTISKIIDYLLGDHITLRSLRQCNSTLRNAVDAHHSWRRYRLIENGKINRNCLRLRAIKSQGSEGTCFNVLSLIDSQSYALKKSKRFVENVGVPYFLIREINALKRLRHNNIAQLLHAEIRLSHLYMLYPYVEFTLDDLLKYLRPGSDRFPNTTVKALMHQLVDAVSYCHEMGIMHRNLKPKHILLKRRGEQTPIFDFSVFVHSPADITLLVSDFALTRNAVLMSAPMTDQVVSLWYRAPEILMGKQYIDERIDVWSIGCIYIEMLRGGPPFQGWSQIDQLFQIFNVLGTPTKETWEEFSSLPNFQAELFPNWHANGSRAALAAQCRRNLDFPILGGFNITSTLVHADGPQGAFTSLADDEDLEVIFRCLQCNPLARATSLELKALLDTLLKAQQGAARDVFQLSTHLELAKVVPLRTLESVLSAKKLHLHRIRTSLVRNSLRNEQIDSRAFPFSGFLRDLANSYLEILLSRFPVPRKCASNNEVTLKGVRTMYLAMMIFQNCCHQITSWESSIAEYFRYKSSGVDNARLIHHAVGFIIPALSCLSVASKLTAINSITYYELILSKMFGLTLKKTETEKLLYQRLEEEEGNILSTMQFGGDIFCNLAEVCYFSVDLLLSVVDLTVHTKDPLDNGGTLHFIHHKLFRPLTDYKPGRDRSCHFLTTIVHLLLLREMYIENAYLGDGCTSVEHCVAIIHSAINIYVAAIERVVELLSIFESPPSCEISAEQLRKGVPRYCTLMRDCTFACIADMFPGSDYTVNENENCVRMIADLSEHVASYEFIENFLKKHIMYKVPLSNSEFPPRSALDLLTQLLCDSEVIEEKERRKEK